MKYDVFICYRRDGGEYTAKILNDKLTDLGYKVFFDIESLRSGQFNTKLFAVIDECEDFISVLSPNCLDRCLNEDDWVRLEIAYAIKKNKNVIPVLLRGFKFPDELPEDIDNLRYHSGLEASTEFFDAFAKKLSKFFKSKPLIIHRIIQNSLLKTILPFILALFVVFGVVFSGYRIYQSTQASFPYTNADKNTIREVVYYVSTNFTYANIAMMEYEEAISSCRDYFNDPTELNYSSLETDLAYRKAKITEEAGNYVELDDNLSNKLDDTILSKNNIIAVKDTLIKYTDEMLHNIDFISYLATDSLLAKTTKLKILDYYQKSLDIEKNILFYGVNDIFLEVNDDALVEFKTEILPSVNTIYDGQEWRDDKDEIKAITDTNFAKLQKNLVDVASIYGDANITADLLASKLSELQDDSDELNDLLAEAKEKFMPLESDDINTLWGKMLKFNSLKMYDICIQCLEMYHEKDDTEEADTFIPIAIEFFNQVDTTGIDFGCMVCGYEPNKIHNSFYQLGDILIEINGQKIVTIEDIATAKGDSNNSYRVKVLRLNNFVFTAFEAELQPEDPKVLFYDMCESTEE